MDYGLAIRLVRAHRGIEQRDLALLLKVDPSYISLLEHGLRTPSLQFLEKVSKEIKIPVFLLVLLASTQEDLKNSNKETIDKLRETLLLSY